MRIYIVTGGEYSDYRIVKVFLDKSAAKSFVSRAADHYFYGYRVEEYDTEDEADINLLPYKVYLRKNQWHCHYDEYAAERCKRDVFTYRPYVDAITKDMEGRLYRIDDCIYLRNSGELLKEDNLVYASEEFTMNLMAKDREAALKIAHERLGAIKSMGNVFKPNTPYMFPSYKVYAKNEV